MAPVRRAFDATRRLSRVRALPVALALLFAVPQLAGCFDEEPDPALGKPTSFPMMPPVPPTPTRQAREFNATDPGYRVTTPWHVGDGWDWESNGTPREYRTVRVVEQGQVGEFTVFRIQETTGRVGSPSSARTTQWVDGTLWRLVNLTDSSGSTFYYDPPKELRFYRNATFAFNESGLDRLSGNVIRNEWFTASFVEPRWEVVRLPWGQVAAFRVAHESFTADTVQPLLTQWVSPDYGNPLQYRVGNVLWTMVAAREGGRQLGVLQPTG